MTKNYKNLFLYFFFAVNKISNIPKDDETLICTKKLLQVMSVGQLLPPPLSNLHEIITYFDSNEVK